MSQHASGMAKERAGLVRLEIADGRSGEEADMRHSGGRRRQREWPREIRLDRQNCKLRIVAAQIFRLLDERGEGYKARNFYFSDGDVGGLFIVAAMAILDTAKNRAAAERFIEYMLEPKAQQYFTEKTKEYPLIQGVDADEGLQPLSEIEPPEIDLSDLTDLQGSLNLMRETGILP